MSTSTSAGWALGKRAFHWALAIAVVIALLAPKPDDGAGLVHVIAGSTAAALVLARIGWRVFSDVRPYVKDAWRLKWPDLSKGLRGVAPTLMQSGRLGGLLFLALIPIALGFALVGLTQGEDSLFLEAHEAVGTAIMVLAIGHAAAIILFALATKYDLLGTTLTGGVRTVFEGGARGVFGLLIGAAVGAAVLANMWGPFAVQTKLALLAESEAVSGATRSEIGSD